MRTTLVPSLFPSRRGRLRPQASGGSERLPGSGGRGGGDALSSGSVDVFTSSHVLEHVSDPCEWLAEVWRLLRPGGIVFTELPIQYFSFSALENASRHNGAPQARRISLAPISSRLQAQRAEQSTAAREYFRPTKSGLFVRQASSSGVAASTTRASFTSACSAPRNGGMSSATHRPCPHSRS